MTMADKSKCIFQTMQNFKNVLISKNWRIIKMIAKSGH